MSVEALLKLREDVGLILSQKANALKSQLYKLGVITAVDGRRGRRVSAMKGRLQSRDLHAAGCTSDMPGFDFQQAENR
jgi:hypothetical protein